MLGPQYVRSPIGIAKLFVLAASAAALILAGSTRPTDLQKQIVDSTWKEDGLFYLSITGIIITLMSVAWSIVFRKECENFSIILREMCIFGIGCAAFLVFGFGTLESALNIFRRVGDCCEDSYNETNNTCTLPGFILDNYYAYALKPTKAAHYHENDDDMSTASEFSNIPECSNLLKYNSWRCTICINELIQPNFEVKGAAGAAGLIAALAYFIVVFVAIRERRLKKPTLPSIFKVG